MPRGGWRGGGRPQKTPGIKRSPIGCRVKDDVKDWLYAEKDRTDKSIGELVDLAVEVLQKHPDELPPDADTEDSHNAAE